MTLGIVRLLAWVAVALVTDGAAIAQTGIGSAVLVDNRVEGQLDGAPEKITVDAPVFQNQRITTYAESRVGMELADGTTLALGPNSEIVLDRFVYDPGSGAGDIILNAVKGSFRFVTGLAQPGSYKVVTDVAAIGIRGTDFDVYSVVGGTLVLARAGLPFACPRRLENDLDPRHGSCCLLDADEAGAPLYGIVTRRGRRCIGPLEWTGTNPGLLLRRHVSAERRREHHDGSENGNRPPTGGSGGANSDQTADRGNGAGSVNAGTNGNSGDGAVRSDNDGSITID
jgi:hypothetical protein